MKYLMVLIFSLLAFNADAADSYYCAQTNQTITLGNTMAAVQAACGNPTQNRTQTQQINNPVDVTRWVYSLGRIGRRHVFAYAANLTLTIQGGKVTAIKRNAVVGGIDPFPCTASGAVEIGSSAAQVIAMCGQPDFTSTDQTQTTTTKQLVVWTYSQGAYFPQIELQFENGLLVAIGTGNTK